MAYNRNSFGRIDIQSYRTQTRIPLQRDQTIGKEILGNEFGKSSAPVSEITRRQGIASFSASTAIFIEYHSEASEPRETDLEWRPEE